MRIKMDFELDKAFLPIDYRPLIISFFKYSISQYSSDFFDELYNNTNQKAFTFYVNLPMPEFRQDSVLLSDNKFSITFSTYDYGTFMVFYNSLLQQKEKTYPLASNFMMMKCVKTIMDKPNNSNEILVRFKSPLVVRDHSSEQNKDIYLDYSQKDFATKLKEIILLQSASLKFLNVNCSSFEIESVNPKRTVVTAFKNRINCSLGVYKIKGDNRLLDYLYNAGLGSRRSQGFGMFEIIS